MNSNQKLAGSTSGLIPLGVVPCSQRRTTHRYSSS